MNRALCADQGVALKEVRMEDTRNARKIFMMIHLENVHLE
jgi:hypothetical protein